MSYQHRLGKLGEKIAERYLLSRGYLIFDKNFSVREGEIDIVCQKEKTIIFVEVKTRTTGSFGWPEEAVTESKLDKISAAGQHFMQARNLNARWQIDVISIIIDAKSRRARLWHLPNV